jgi:ubiquinone/menaquinone biosynthesis C-methylase UbiE
MPTDERTVQWYDEHAADYTQHVRNPNDSIYHSMYEKPAMYALVPDLMGLSVISLGCGSGEDCNHLNQLGAKRMVGVDISSGLIDIAKTSYPACDFQVMDMEHLDFPDSSFDFVYSSLAVHYLEKWDKMLAETYRILRPGSFFLFSCNHPIYSAMEVTRDDEEAKVRQLARTKDVKTDTVSIVGDYVTRRPMEFNDSWVTWHKSIGEISQEVTDAGFMIAGVHEPKPLPEMAKLSPKDYETLSKIPNFVIFKLWKPTA